MYAVIKTGGKQYKVSEGDVLFVEKMDTQAGETITFNEVSLISDGDKITVGTPVIDGANVTASVLGLGKAKKIIVMKFKAKKGYKKKQGHRQPYTKIKIEKINA